MKKYQSQHYYENKANCNYQCSMAVQAEPTKGNLTSGLMITAVSGGGAATPFIGWATDGFDSITAGISVLLFCAAYLAYCAYSVRINE